MCGAIPSVRREVKGGSVGSSGILDIWQPKQRNWVWVECLLEFGYFGLALVFYLALAGQELVNHDLCRQRVDTLCTWSLII